MFIIQRILSMEHFDYLSHFDSFFLAGRHKVWHPFSALFLSGFRRGLDVFNPAVSFIFTRRALFFFSSALAPRPATSFFLLGPRDADSLSFFPRTDDRFTRKHFFYNQLYIHGLISNFRTVRRNRQMASLPFDLPTVVFTFDVSDSTTGANEASRIGIPFLSFCDSSFNSEMVPYPVPVAYSFSSLKFFISLFVRHSYVQSFKSFCSLFPVPSLNFYFKKKRTGGNWGKRLFKRKSFRRKFKYSKLVL